MGSETLLPNPGVAMAGPLTPNVSSNPLKLPALTIRYQLGGQPHECVEFLGDLVDYSVFAVAQ